MPVTLNILIDHINHRHPVAHIESKINPVFKGIRRLTGSSDFLPLDYLYVCSCSLAVKAKQTYPNRYYLCPGDSLPGYLENKDLTSIILSFSIMLRRAPVST